MRTNQKLGSKEEPKLQKILHRYSVQPRCITTLKNLTKMKKIIKKKNSLTQPKTLKLKKACKKSKAKSRRRNYLRQAKRKMNYLLSLIINKLKNTSFSWVNLVRIDRWQLHKADPTQASCSHLTCIMT